MQNNFGITAVMVFVAITVQTSVFVDCQACMITNQCRSKGWKGQNLSILMQFSEELVPPSEESWIYHCK